MDDVILLHGTSATALLLMLSTDELMAHDTHGDGMGLGLSLTRSRRIARRFAGTASDRTAWCEADGPSEDVDDVAM